MGIPLKKSKKMTSLYWILGCLLLLGTAPEATLSASTGDQCEPLTMPLCQGLAYNYTLMPNMLGHTKQEEAGLEAHQFAPLVKVGCSPQLKEFLCSLYVPPCSAFAFVLPPCRSLCIEAKQGCETFMSQFGFAWPQKFRCEAFPLEHDGGICIASLDKEFLMTTTPSPSAMLTTEDLTPKGPAEETHCRVDKDCLFTGTSCRNGECVCEYPRAWGPAGCEETQVLDGPCSNTGQCAAVTPNAVCRDEVCACAPPLSNYMNLACIHASGVGELCYSDAQCRATNVHSFCRFFVSKVVGTCACDPDQFLNSEGRCDPRLGGRCLKGSCPSALGLATCRQGRDGIMRCACRRRTHEELGVCIKD
ncbi:uncharacterized protein LOC143035827 isoform X2 [Oratosquilla oratoria]|uniref:uncharacterized protein LOC143035827 isoform X2 n=1 Tax=Oratosquilla oratoria TaxID=337810 RepID=UPI003F75A84A